MKLVVYNVFKAQLLGLPVRLGRFTKHADFLLVQEWVSSLKQHSEYIYTPNFTFRFPVRRVRTGTCTIAKNTHKTISVETVLTNSRELGFMTRKSAILSTHKVRGKELLLVNLHALNFVHNRVWKRELKALVEKIPKNIPAIIAGDFNTWNPSRFNFLEPLLAKLGFSYAHYNHNIILRLDHVFYRGLIINSCECLVTVHNSDHYPLLVDFDFLDE